MLAGHLTSGDGQHILAASADAGISCRRNAFARLVVIEKAGQSNTRE
jgi:hypothetical protein